MHLYELLTCFALISSVLVCVVLYPFLLVCGIYQEFFLGPGFDFREVRVHTQAQAKVGGNCSSWRSTTGACKDGGHIPSQR